MRTDLLNPQEKAALKEALRNNILFKGFEKSIRQLTMTEDGCYTISCEDIFCVVAEEIDNILEDPKNAAFNVRDLWGRLEDGYQDLVDRNLTQEKINNLVGTTICCIQVFFQYADNYQFHDLYLPLAAGLEDHRVGWRKMYAVILGNIRRLGSDDFKKAVAEYLTSEEYLSDVIVEAIRIDKLHEKIIKGQTGKSAMLAYIAALMLGLEDYMEWTEFEKKYPGVSTRTTFYGWMKKYNEENLLDTTEYQNRIREFQAQMKQ